MCFHFFDQWSITHLDICCRNLHCRLSVCVSVCVCLPSLSQILCQILREVQILGSDKRTKTTFYIASCWNLQSSAKYWTHTGSPHWTLPFWMWVTLAAFYVRRWISKISSQSTRHTRPNKFTIQIVYRRGPGDHHTVLTSWTWDCVWLQARFFPRTDMTPKFTKEPTNFGQKRGKNTFDSRIR